MEKNKDYIVVSRQDAVGRNTSYINLKIRNENDIENICVFGVEPLDHPVVGELVSFINFRDNQGRKTADKMDIKTKECPPNHSLYKFFPRPIDKESWNTTIEKLLSSCEDKVLKDFIKNNTDNLFETYSKYPAATSVHHAYPGGLLNHTYQMLHLLEGIYPVYPYPDDIKVERIIVSILFHDWGKICEYSIKGEKLERGYLLGHIYMSANHLNNLLRDLYTEAHGKVEKDDKCEINRIVHCVLAHHGQLEFGSPVLPCTPEAQLLNFLDNISAKADVFNTTGDMEKAFALGTNVIKG